MLQLIWFLLKIGLLVAGAIWLAQRPGQVDIQWMDYEITIHFGFFLLIFFVLLLLTIGLTRFSLFFTGMPGRRKLKKTIKNNEKGMEALTLSLSSAAAGDYGYAQYQAERALKLLPGSSQPLPLLLQAGAQRKQGQYDKADETLKAMLSHPEGAVLAARALIGNAVEQNNIVGALSYARTADRDYKGKDKGWLLETLYELEAKAGNWLAAEESLNKALKKKAISKEKAEKDYIAIATSRVRELIPNGDEKTSEKMLKAVLKKDPAFQPAVSLMFDMYLENGKGRAASNLLKKAWKTRPHPQFVLMWTQAGLLFGKKDDDLAWLRKLTGQNPNHLESYLALAENNLRGARYDDAKINLDAAMEIARQRRIFKLLIELAEKTGSSEATIRHHIEQMADADPDPIWVCKKTGRTYDRWAAVSLPHGSFNTMVWGDPGAILKAANMNQGGEFFELLTASS